MREGEIEGAFADFYVDLWCVGVVSSKVVIDFVEKLCSECLGGPFGMARRTAGGAFTGSRLRFFAADRVDTLGGPSEISRLKGLQS